MNSIIAIGETVYDIIFRDGKPVAARAGGSMLNTAVSLGRAGCKVMMITELGDDRVGRIVMDFLQENGVSTEFIRPVRGFKTPVSLAFLDEQGNAGYSFYKDYPSERLEIEWPQVNKGDIVLFGSFYSLGEGVREKIIRFIRNARQEGGMIFYDPNIRKNHLNEIRTMMDRVEENIALSDIVRGSDEDFMNLFGLIEPEEIYQKVKDCGCNNLLITRGKYGAELYSGNKRISQKSEEIKITSTIGAGDAFNAGLIFGLEKYNLSSTDLVNINSEIWKSVLSFGIKFASDVCSSYDNYISADLAKTLNEKSDYH